MATETYTPTQLLVGDRDVSPRLVKVAAGNTLAVGAALRRKLAAAIAAVAENTGDGAPGEVVLGLKARLGTYVLECTAASADGGTFAVFAPDGTRLADLAVGVAYDNGHFALTLADGAADFVVGDAFEIEVTDSGETVPYDSPHGIFAGILAEAVDAASAAAYGTAWRSGEFRRAAVTFAAGVALDATIETALERAGCLLVPTQG